MRSSFRCGIAVGCVALSLGCANSNDPSVTPADDDTMSSSQLAPDVQQRLVNLPEAHVRSVSPQGLPTFLVGRLATVAGHDEVALQTALNTLAPMYRLKPTDLRLRSIEQDSLSFTHARYQQTHEGLPVDGGELSLHVDANGQVYAVVGHAQGSAVDAVAAVTESAATATALKTVQGNGLTALKPTLAYLVPSGGSLTLTWKVEVDGQRDRMPVRDIVYVDAKSGASIEVHPQVHSALSRAVHTAKNGTSLPGDVMRSEGNDGVQDGTVNASYDHLGETYACYQQLFQRDSLDGSGMQLSSSVHYDRNYSNAFWDGSQMVFGDGDGQEFANLAESLDITAHELTHAVTEHTANLNYQGESGALNEGFSDIMGATCEAHFRGLSEATWMLGEDVYTPGKQGDALRYMNDPARDGYSTDWYPGRYTGGDDNGGVHSNSGIANLAYQLLVSGGGHPHGKSTNHVPGIGLEKAGAIFYRALTQYLKSGSDFQEARSATAQAAKDLYGDQEVTAVQEAWNAVGVPGYPGY